MKSGNIVLIILMIVGALVAAAGIGTHIFECVLAARKKKEKLRDAEKSVRSMSSGLNSETLKSPISPSCSHRREPSTPGRINGVQLLPVHDLSKIPPANYPTSPTLTIPPHSLCLNSDFAVPSPVTPSTANNTQSNQECSLLGPIHEVLDSKHRRSVRMLPQITRTRLAKFATPPRKASIPILSFSIEKVPRAMRTTQLGGRNPILCYMAPPGEMPLTFRIDDNGMQGVSKIGW